MLPISLRGSLISEKPWKAGVKSESKSVSLKIRIVENNAVLELLDISVWCVENLPPAPSGRALKGLMLYSGGVEL